MKKLTSVRTVFLLPASVIVAGLVGANRLSGTTDITPEGSYDDQTSTDKAKYDWAYGSAK